MSTSIAYSHVQLFRKVIQDTLVQCHQVFSGEQELFTYFYEQVTTGLNVRQIGTVEGLQTLTGEAFLGNVSVRNYILTMETIFFANLGDRHALLASLHDVLVDAMSFKQPSDEKERKLVLMPADITERQASGAELVELFEYNRWIIPIIALILWSRPVYGFVGIKENNAIVQKAYKLPSEKNNG